MSEFCLDCWNKLNDTHDKPFLYVLSRETDLCEECGMQKHVIIRARKWYSFYLALREARGPIDRRAGK